jgi:hypothetical protein
VTIFEKDSIAFKAMMTVPGLAPGDVAIDTRESAAVVVTLHGPAADEEAVEAVRAALEMHVPFGLNLDVVLWSGAA